MSQQQKRPIDDSISDVTSPTSPDTDSIAVLHVDDDANFVETAGALLERENDAITVKTVTSPAEALDQLNTDSIDCIVSDYDMPQTDGLEFLREVRDCDDDLPFILYTGRGDEEIASEAISAGVTDYLQKGGGTEQYTVLANRIENAVSQHRAECAVEEAQERFRKLIEYSTDVISIVDAEGRWQYLTPSAKRILGYDPEELIGNVGFDYVHSEDRQNAMAKFAHAINHPDQIPTVKFRFDHPDGWKWLENRARNMVDDSVINGFVVHTRDVTKRTRREQELTRQNERLEEVINAVSHDLRNPLNVGVGTLEVVQQTGDHDDLARAKGALERMDQIIDDLVTFAREGERVEDLEPVEFDSITQEAWKTVETGNGTLNCENSGTIQADRSRLQRVLENLFHNAVDHGGPDVTVYTGTMSEGFYVEDTGPGIPEANFDQIFESGYSTNENGTGFGLSIVEQIVQAHEWEINLTDGRTGGSRFEITEVTFV